tara:strand:+ start:5098 stop:6186 length:1089 start_codon:yes stop_codon:yes gene_type:complete
MDDLNILLSGLAISQLLLLGSYTYSRARGQRLGRFLIFFTICLASFLLGAIPVIDTIAPLDFLLSSLAILTPAALWLFSVTFFTDEKRVPAYGLGLIALYFTLQTLYFVLDYLNLDTGMTGYYIGELFPLLIMVGLSFDVIYLGVKGRRGDLLEERRRLRLPFVISMSLVIVFTLSVDALFPLLQSLLPAHSNISVIGIASPLIYGAVFMWTLSLNFAIFRFDRDPELLLENASHVDIGISNDKIGEKASNKDEKLKLRIDELMSVQKSYRETGLTLSRLSDTLSVSEQRLRTTINQAMGFRNFNQFLNYYRINEATQLIADSEDSIAKIAMDVGYNSLSAFNKAFRETHGMTPREFRARAS